MQARAAGLVLALLAVAVAGCAAPPPTQPPDGPPAPDGPGLTEAAILAAARAFNGTRAMDLVKAQVLDSALCRDRAASRCDPRIFRVTGSPGNNQTAGLIAVKARNAGFHVALDGFTAGLGGQPVPAHNVVATRDGATNRTLILGAHYDSRPCADKDPDAAKRTERVLGANDGGSGVAVLLELARLLGQRSMNLTLRLVFFDAEDMGDGGHGCGAGTAWAQGSARDAANLTAAQVAGTFGLVLLDMVGDANLTLRREASSAQAPHRALQDDVWAWAGRLQHPQFAASTGWSILDDHTAYQQRGVRALDVIHLDDSGDGDQFPATHHTTFDDPDHMGTASLQAVGETVLAAVLDWDGQVGRQG